MKKVTSFLIALTAFTGTIIASPVPVNSAQQVAANFYSQNSHMAVSSITLAYTEKDNSGNAVYYAFNVNGNAGFVIVSADDALHPIIGYSNEGKPFVAPEKGTNVDYWMQKRKNEIINAAANKHTATAEVADEWNSYMNNKIPQSIINNKFHALHKSVNSFPWYKTSHTSLLSVPFKVSAKNDVTSHHVFTTFPSSTTWLVQTLWDQNNPSGTAATKPYIYNALCPAGCYTGCVATTMAQIMKFWAFPTKGIGASSYCDCTADNFSKQNGTLSADYGAMTYHWSNMVANPTKASDIDTLMFDAGVSVDMDYNTTGSGAEVLAADAGGGPCAQYSYASYFGYTTDILDGLQYSSTTRTWTATSWQDTLEAELNHNRPIEYAGQETAGGHTWVCDGYESNNDFHMNWGWNGVDDGFFALSNLDPAGQGTFNSDLEALVGILPPTAPPSCVGSGLCDTITNLPGDAQLTYYEVTNNTFITGTYGDTIQKIADYFASPPCKGYEIGSVYIDFAKASSTTAMTVTVNIWDNTGTTPSVGSPGKVIATQTVTVSSIATDISNSQPTLVTFSTPATVTTPYYVGVDYTTLAADYKLDTLAVVTDTTNQGLATAWQYDVATNYGLNGWYPDDQVWTDFYISHAIYVNVCQPTDVYTADLEEGIKLYPNPTSGIVNADISLEQATNVNVEVYNVLGQLVQQAHWDNVLNSTYSLDLSGQSNGMYFVKIISDKSTITKKIMLNR
ncbi:MAG: thiol protease/hemagglutinin PrtT [Bacteroidia bacterium]